MTNPKEMSVVTNGAIVVFCAFHALAQQVNFIRPQGKIDFANSIRFRLLFGLLWDFLLFLIEQRFAAAEAGLERREK